MGPTNRIELIPLQVFTIETALVLSAFLTAIAYGPAVSVALVAFMVIAYALGAYDRRPNTLRSRFATALIAALLVSAALAVSIRGGRLLTYSVLSVIALACVHVIVGRILELGATPVTVVYPRDDQHVVRSVADLAAQLRYPVTFHASESQRSWTATFPQARTDKAPGVAEYTMVIDPVAFCQNALRAIPPALFSPVPDSRPNRRLYGMTKRLVDIVASATSVAVTLPLWIFAAIGILLADGRPVFFRQTRIGRYGVPFSILKFRTLRTTDAPSSDPTANIGTRTFAFGTLLRRTRIDELPQLLQVLSGRMSIVGPRPEMLYYHERSTAGIPSYERRLDAPPGLTGWAQIHYAHSVTADEYLIKTALDLWYVRNRGLLLDVRIMLKTIGILLRRFGSR